MKNLAFLILAALLLTGCDNKKPVDDRLHQEGLDMASQRLQKIEEENIIRFLQGTNKNENVSLSIKDSILTVKVISKPDAGYSSFIEFYHDLAHRSNVHITGSELRDSLSGKILARTGYGFKTSYNE